MTIEIAPEFGVELPPDITYVDLRERARAACESIKLLEDNGLQVEETAQDREAAASLLAAYAADPQAASKAVNSVRASALTPATLQNIRSYLDEYGKAVVTHALEMRHLVTNRLLEESQNPDPRIRIRALELLGKHSDVGLFTERSEVTVTHQSTDELRAKLREKLSKLTRPVQLDGEIIDVDAELGLKPLKSGEVFVPESEISGDSGAGS
jgi:hypothetical protein